MPMQRIYKSPYFFFFFFFEISGVSRNKQTEGKISILGSLKSKKVTKILHSHQRNLYQFCQNKIL